MAISNAVNALLKLVGEDSINGIPVRNADAAGNIIAGANRVIVQAGAAQNASGQTAAQQPSSLYREILFFLKVTAVAGTTPTLNVYVDVSDDGGTTWYQAGQLGPANIAAVPAAPYSGYTLTLSAASSSGPWGDTYRIRWVIAGSAGPSFTFQVTAIHK